MGRWTLTALVINSTIGSGIFGLPSVVAGYLGKQSPLAYLAAAAGIGVVIACFAEVGSQFGSAGGPYLYAREAFGRFIGIEIAWLLWLVRLTAAAAALNIFTDYLAEFWPGVREPITRLIVLTVLIGFLAVVNVRGIESVAAANNMFTVAKLAPLILFVIVGGVFLILTHGALPSKLQTGASFPVRNWLEAVLVLTFAYGGFDAAVIPMAEAKDPRRDTPFALFAALVTVTLLFCAIQYVVVGVLPGAAATDRPLAVAARQFGGTTGAALISAGALFSIYGYLTAGFLNSPRLAFALGEKGDFPRIFSRIHSRYRTPHISILAFAGIVWCLAVAGSFRWNVFISSVGRLLIYGFTCAALPVLRRKYPNARAYRLPAGDLFAALGVLFVVLLASRMSRNDGIVFLATIGIAFANWVWARNSREKVS